MKKRIISIILMMTLVISALSLVACDLGDDSETSANESTTNALGPKPEPPAEEKTAAEVYAMVEKYFEYDMGDVNYTWKKTTESTLDGNTTRSTDKGSVGTFGIGTDDFVMKISEDEGSMSATFTYVAGWAYTHIYEKRNDETTRTKQAMTPAKACAMLRESDVGYQLPFSFSDFTNATVVIENNRYVLTLSGLTEEEYIEEVLGLEDRYANLAREYYSFSPENFTMTFTVTSTGALYSMNSNTSYTFFATMENSGTEGTFEYVIKDEIEVLGGIMVRVPSDADTYVVIEGE